MPTPTAPDLEVPPDAPSLVTLPTVDQIAEAIVTDRLKGGPVTGEGWHVTAAKAVLDLLAAHVEPAESASAWRDNMGDIWHQRDDGRLDSFETAPFPRERVEKRWGPLTMLDKKAAGRELDGGTWDEFPVTEGQGA